MALRYRARSGEPPRKLAPDAFALVREAGARVLSACGISTCSSWGVALVARGLAEMQTGEGKTLTATLPMYLFALYGKGRTWPPSTITWLAATAELMQPVYRCWA
ncbi:MAG: hypothetical protein QM775_08835 [Pirellulales bacterium]